MTDKNLITIKVAEAGLAFGRRHSAALIVDRKPEPPLVGSAVCVDCGSALLLATAGHNLDDIPNPGKFKVFGGDSGERDQGVFARRWHARKERGAGSRDIAWVEVPAGARTRGFVGIGLDAVATDLTVSDAHALLAVGVPFADTAYDQSSNHLDSSPLAYLTTLEGQGTETEFLLSYSEEATGSTSPLTYRSSPMPEPHGMSGGAVWLASLGWKDSAIWTPTDFRLVGLIRSFSRERRRLYCVRIRHWLELVREDFPELRSAISRSLGPQ